jgi:hypothetical protein
MQDFFNFNAKHHHHHEERKTNHITCKQQITTKTEKTTNVE